MTIPGPPTLSAGDMQAGYFDIVSADKLITGDALCSAIGLSVGTSQYSNTDWLKFAYKGKIQFVAMKPIRYNLSWDDINAVGAVYGNSTITIDGLTYKVRLFRGAEHDPTNSYADTDRDAIGSEWNDLMFPIHGNATTGNWAHPAYVGTVPDWVAGFTDDELITHWDYGNGSITWCQEVDDTDTTCRVTRGGTGVSYLESVPVDFRIPTFGFRPVLELCEMTIPGPPTLIAGDMQAGYFGIVSANDFITGDALCSAIGLSAGISQYSNTDWLKFAYKGKIQFVAMKPIRYNLSWDDINSAGAIYGKNITIGDLTYKVRLFIGAENDPTNSYGDVDRDAIGSEWNSLMLPIHEHAATGSWAYPAFAGTVPDWGVGFTDVDLLTHYNHGNGSYTWCQEVRDTNTAHRVYRGRSGVSYLSSYSASFVSMAAGFRPVLELPGTYFLESILDSFRHSENFLRSQSKYRPVTTLTNVNTTLKSNRVRLVVLGVVSRCVEHFSKGCNKLRSANYIASVKNLSDSFRGRIKISREVFGTKHRDEKLIGLSKLLFSRLHMVTSSGRSLGMVKNLKASLQIVTVPYSRIRNWTMRLFGKIKSGSLRGKVRD